MASVSVETELDAGADEAWKTIGDFRAVIEALLEGMGGTIEIEGEGIGAVRRATLFAADLASIMGGDGTERADTATTEPIIISEELKALDDKGMTTSYAIVERGPLPFDDYYSTMQVIGEGPGRSRFRWSCTFQPVGVSEEEALAAARTLYDWGANEMRRRFASAAAGHR